MDIYLLICVQDRNAPYQMMVHRILKCIPTTMDKMNAEYEQYMREYASKNIDYPNFYSLLISRHEDTSFLEQEEKHNAG